MENLQEKFNTVLAHFEPEKGVKFETLVQELMPMFNENLIRACTLSGVELVQQAAIIPHGSSLAKAKMKFHWYINAPSLEHPLKLELSFPVYNSKSDDLKISYLQQFIKKEINSLLKVKNIKSDKPLHVRFDEMLTTYKKGFQITPTHLETLGKVNKIIRSHSLKLFGNTITEPTIYDYCYGSKVTLNEIINIIKESELNTNP